MTAANGVDADGVVRAETKRRVQTVAMATERLTPAPVAAEVVA